ncbi:MAG: alkaline phosphatase D family protein [Betaproteobacteria bacterium]|nr:alkaline phosphatase D family protein [Betaproteobacteria bacterium]
MKACTRSIRRLGATLAVAFPLAAGAQLLASGDPTEASAVLWTHVDEAGAYRFEVAEDAHFDVLVARAPVRATAATGLTAQANVKGLKPETRYYFRLVTAAGAPLPAKASFATAPAPGQARPVKILFGADLGGQGYGRLRPGTGLKVDGWPIFVPMLAERPDLFLALGDMVYSDRGLKAEAPDKAYPKGNDYQIPKPGPGYASNLEDFRRDWLYHRDDRHYDRFLKATPLVATWDDHELVNDTGCPELSKGPTREELARDPRLKQGDPSRPYGEFVPWGPKDGKGRRKSVFHNPVICRAGRQAMFEWNPVAVLPDSSGTYPRRLYRTVRWGRHAEVFMLDSRSYRDPRYREDTEAKPKTMLGAAQKRWLLEGLAKSDATWKIIVSSVPLSLESGGERDMQGRVYRDSWAPAGEGNPYGYGRELREIATFLREKRIANVLFLTADQHFSNLFAYDTDGDGRPDFHEANIGVLRAGPFPGKQAIDPMLGPTRVYTDAGKAAFTYGAVMIDGESGALAVTYHGADGAPIPGAKLALEPVRAR